MKRPDLSKQAIQAFFLLHAEKIAISVCAVGLLVVAWMGLTVPVFDRENPSGLSTRAIATAGSFIEAADAWEQLEPHRKPGFDAAQMVQNKFETAMDVADYRTGSLLGPYVQLAAMRKPPALVKPSRPLVVVDWAPIYIAPERPRPNKITLLSDAKGSSAAAAGGTGDNSRGSDTPPDDLESTGGGRTGDQNRGNASNAPVVNAVPYTIPGEVMTPVQEQEWVGVRPTGLKRGSDAFMVPIVQIVATLDMTAQKKAFLDALKDTRAYFPDRDRPDWYAVQVERNEEGSTEWVDITKVATVVQEGLYGRRAPEVASPAVYSARISRALPPIADFDYRRLLTAAGIPLRNLKPADLFATASNEPVREQRTSLFTTGDSKAETESGEKEPPLESYYGSNFSIYLPAKSTPAKNAAEADPAAVQPPEARLLRVFDLEAPKGKRFRYRVTAWLENPNNTAADLAEGKGYFFTHFNRDAADSGAPNDSQTTNRGGNNRGGQPGDDRGGGDSTPTADSTPKSGEPGYVLTDIRESDLDPEVRRINREKQAMRARLLAPETSETTKREEIWKTFCLASEPVESDWVEPLSTANPSRLAVGKSREAKSVNINQFSIPRDEPEAEVALSHWSAELRSWVPGYRRDFRRGESTNIEVPFSHILDLGSLIVKRLAKSDMKTREVHSELAIRTNQVIVDIAAGRPVDLKTPMPFQYAEQKDPPELTMPSEVLVMDELGNFVVHNEYDDLRSFRNQLFLPDETNTYGKAKAAKPAVEDDRGGRGGQDR